MGSSDPQLPRDSARRVGRFLGRVRLRAALVYATRAACAAAGTTALVLIASAAIVGPVVTLAQSFWLRLAIGLSAVFSFGFTLFPLFELASAHGQRLLARYDRALASRALSVLELCAEGAHVPSGSHALIAAHAERVQREVTRVPPAAVVPLRWLRHPSVGWSLALGVLSTVIAMSSAEIRAGARAIVLPASITDDGLRVAPLVRSLEVRLSFPSYLKREPAARSDFQELTLPRGTSLEISVRPILPSRHGALRVGDEIVRMHAEPDGTLLGRFVARKSTPLGVRVLHEGTFYEDDDPRRISVLEDRAPSVQLEDAVPEASVVTAEDVLTLPFTASDDHGLVSADLVVRLPTGEELRERVWSELIAGDQTTTLEERAVLHVAKLELQPGDVATIFVEGRDGDLFSGPHVGASRVISIELASEAKEISLHVPMLREVLDRGLDALADRIESAPPVEVAQAQRRMRELHEHAELFVDGLRTLIAAASRTEAKHGQGVDVDQLRGIADRTQRALAREASVYQGDQVAHKRMQEADRRLVAEHERDVLLLADMLASTLVDEARALTSELNALKQRMRELLQDLKQAPSEAKKRELLSEIQKAQRRLRELAQSLSRLSQRVPSEFINHEAIPQSEAKGSMDELSAAIEAGDMEAAERHLDALAQEIDSLAQHVDQGGSRFREARFGAHDKAVANARNQLSTLAEEQERLAGRSADVTRRAAERAKERAQTDPDSLASMRTLADEMQRSLDAFGQPSSLSSDGQLLGQARERTRDAVDALKTGDLSESRRMASAAQRSLDMLAASLEQDARMFPGHRGEAQERAQAAAEAARKASRFRDQLDRAMPPLQDFVGAKERERLREDVVPQRATRDAVDALGRNVGGGEDAPPVSPDAERGLREVGEAMRRAEQALAQGDPDQASHAQEEAADRLRQLEQQMARRGRSPGDSGEPTGERRDRREGEGGKVAEGPVRIPSADEFHGPIEMRRRVLDAMRQEAPSGFRHALDRYYEELLK